MASDDLARDLAEALINYPAAEEQAYSPSVVFNGGTGYIDTGVIEGETPTDLSPVFRECLQAAGHDPDTVRIGAKLKESHWTQRVPVREWSEQHQSFIKTGEYETHWLHSYRFETVLNSTASSHDIEAIVLSAQAKDTSGEGPYWYVFQASDLQLGKRSRDGSTPEIIERFISSVNSAKRELESYKQLGIGGVQISFPGDCLEGNQSQKGQNLWLTQETITEQTRIFRRLMMYAVDQLSDAPKVYLDVVNGNHDEAQRQQNTYPGNGWATETAIAVSDAIALNSNVYGHVEVRVPDKWSGSMTVPVGDSIVTVIHGHQWTRAQGPMKWLAGQAVNHQPAGATQVLQHGHHHEFRVESNEHKIALCSPTFDMGSDWYREKTGATAKVGALTYLLRSGEVSKMGLL